MTEAEVLEDIARQDLWPTTYVSERMVYIVGISEAGNLLEQLKLLDPATSPLEQQQAGS